MAPQRYTHYQYADGDANKTDGITPNYGFLVVKLLLEDSLCILPEFIHILHGSSLKRQLLTINLVVANLL